jgi:hypothetical protein
MLLLKERNVSHEKNAYERCCPNLSVSARQLRLLTVYIQRGRANIATNRTVSTFQSDLGRHGG